MTVYNYKFTKKRIDISCEFFVLKNKVMVFQTKKKKMSNSE